jgi:signal transduction histidine kinase/ActR/RegA family two-component response regulator
MAAPRREIFLETCREIVNLLPCDRIDLSLPSHDTESFTVTTLYPEAAEPGVWEVPREGSCSAEVMRKWKTELWPTLGTEFHYAEEEILYRQGIRDAAFLPLKQGHEPFGVLILGATEPQSLEGRGIRQLERSAGIISLALASADPERVIGEGKADPGAPAGRRDAMGCAYRQMVAFSRISNRIYREDDLNEACRLFLQEIRKHTDYRRAILTLLDSQGRDFQWFFTGMSDDEIDAFHTRKPPPEQRNSLPQDRCRIGNSFLVPASPDGGLFRLPPVRRKKTDAPGPALIIPLHGAGDEHVGMLLLDDARSSSEPTAESLSPLELFSSAMAHAIEKKRFDQAVKKAERSLRGAQEQLMQSEKMSAIGQLISGVTHELNNPLSGIIGYAQLLQGSKVEPKERKSLGKIYSEAVRCQKIVQNLLSFSRRHAPEKVRCNLNEVIESVLELRSYQLQVDEIEVVRRYDPDLPGTLFDFHQIQQVILNVVNNAHHAMMEMPGRTRRLITVTERDGGLVRGRIIDTGPGIPRNRLEKIFDSFYTTKAAGKGTGLGLSLSKAIMDDHQGRIGAESVLGEGTTFVIELPLIEEETGEIAPESKPFAEGVARVPLRLLVVDDEEILIELLCDFLKSVGHQVDQARNGRDALRLATDNEYDMILSDLRMPSLDGQGFYDHLCKTKPEMARRFIFSTGDLANPKVQLFFQRTGALYLNKPFRLESVLAVLDQLSNRLQAA